MAPASAARRRPSPILPPPTGSPPRPLELLRPTVLPRPADVPHLLRDTHVDSLRLRAGDADLFWIWPSLGDGSEARSDRFLADRPPANPAKVIYTLVSV